jgi:apolipoprotein D and lipocalin family protein
MNAHTVSLAAPFALLVLLVSGCSTLPPLATVEHVDVPRFMGQWYVVAAIPTLLERDAHNAIESYRLDDDGTIATTFTFHRGGFDGPLKTYRPRGYIQSDSNAIWSMQFLWPFKADYRVIYLADDYSATIIGRQKRDYVWIMARQPILADHALEALIDWVGTAGYDTTDIVRIPQQDLATQAVAERSR